MRLAVKITANARKTEIIEERADYMKLKLQAPAVEGKANAALIAFLADHFDIAKSRITIVKGEKGKDKIVEIKNEP